ncbi:MAG: hypothetical protein MJ062_07465 [Oscillospiraceae bacterium]|nr:hypothetical protein [Oscillospiraceae bacterium]
MEKHFQSKDGRRFLDIGYQSQTAVGSGDKPSEVVPLQEGARLLFAKGIDNWWKIILGGLLLRKIVRAPFKRKKRR